ncbi:hypothetical protein A3C09_01535 [Candidatus Uhrbacteria bacterium RIFCSPHIGHO2_02_FULL_47_44]|nr:MAG: hypothetical protein A3C09_01535 [Candidatus Uhrbacteria bacterium RIFCSPHIGHO2_02_FULL_47_44]
MNLQIAQSGKSSRLTQLELTLVEAGFDLDLFKCEAEMEFAEREIDRVSETWLVKRFGVTPAWIIGDNGEFIGRNGVRKLTRAFKLGHVIGMNTSEWMVHLSSNEVIALLPLLEKRARALTYN